KNTEHSVSSLTQVTLVFYCSSIWAPKSETNSFNFPEMSATGKGKKREEHDQASDGDSEGHAPPKKALKKDSDDNNSDDITVCEIGKNRKVSVRIWQGKIWVDIREFYIKDGKQLPGKKGISLSMDQWNVLREHIEDIDKAVVEKS
ncbi:hypothetical protein KIW84_051927, partial [Lathyrus oleraceus]